MTFMGVAFLDVQLEKDGDWGPRHVFGTVKFDDIVKVENELVEI